MIWWLVLILCVVVILLALRYGLPWWEQKCKGWGERGVRWIRERYDEP
jgi:hypothetical protein